MRVDEAEEIAGLDLVEHGERGYSNGARVGSGRGNLGRTDEMLARRIIESGHAQVKA